MNRNSLTKDDLVLSSWIDAVDDLLEREMSLSDLKLLTDLYGCGRTVWEGYMALSLSDVTLKRRFQN